MANLTNSPFNELFVQDIQEKLFKSNEFLNYITNVSEWLNGRTVHIPQYTHVPSISVDFENPGGGDYDFSDFSADRPAESELTFNVESYQMHPIQVQDFEEMITSYQKFQTVVGQTTKELATRMGSRALYRIAESVPAANYFLTSGNNGTGNGIDGSNDVMLSHEDIKKVAEKMDEDNVPEDSRYIVLPTKMYYELLNESQIIRADYFGTQTIDTGEVPELYGIKILKRSTVLATSTSGNASGADLLDPFTENFNLKNNGQQHVAIAFETSAVAAAWNEPQPYTLEGDPYKFGSIVSAQCALGAANARSGADDAGVYLVAHQDV